ncbi:hypothetical protein QPF19_004513 [Salmonella enterica]|nr:hypothetical protein [Salmonella enterica]
MTTLAIGQSLIHSGNEYAISAVSLADGQITYSVLGMNAPTLANVQESSIRFYQVTDKIFPLDEIRCRRATVQAAISQREAEHQAKEEKRQAADQCARSNPANAGLLTVDADNNTTNLAAKNIRILLKKHFPGVKFSVRKRDYTCINVSWTDGPTKDAVEKIVGGFQEGHFDGMTDMYEYTTTSFNRVYGGVKYLFCERSFSDGLIAEAIAQLRDERGEQAVPVDVSVEAYRRGGLWSKGHAYFFHGLQSEIARKASELNKTC